MKNTACAKLLIIAEQVRFLQEQARKILQDTRDNQDLHNAACNFKKIPGHIYHLYKKKSGQTYFSMLSPEEWGSTFTDKYLGSFRMEQDFSWTSIDKIEEVSKNIDWANRVLNSSSSNKTDFLAIDN